MSGSNAAGDDARRVSSAQPMTSTSASPPADAAPTHTSPRARYNHGPRKPNAKELLEERARIDAAMEKIEAAKGKARAQRQEYGRYLAWKVELQRKERAARDEEERAMRQRIDEKLRVLLQEHREQKRVERTQWLAHSASPAPRRHHLALSGTSDQEEAFQRQVSEERERRRRFHQEEFAKGMINSVARTRSPPARGASLTGNSSGAAAGNALGTSAASAPDGGSAADSAALQQPRQQQQQVQQQQQQQAALQSVSSFRGAPQRDGGGHGSGNRTTVQVGAGVSALNGDGTATAASPTAGPPQPALGVRLLHGVPLYNVQLQPGLPQPGVFGNRTAGSNTARGGPRGQGNNNTNLNSPGGAGGGGIGGGGTGSGARAALALIQSSRQTGMLDLEAVASMMTIQDTSLGGTAGDGAQAAQSAAHAKEALRQERLSAAAARRVDRVAGMYDRARTRRLYATERLLADPPADYLLGLDMLRYIPADVLSRGVPGFPSSNDNAKTADAGGGGGSFFMTATDADRGGVGAGASGGGGDGDASFDPSTVRDVGVPPAGLGARALRWKPYDPDAWMGLRAQPPLRVVSERLIEEENATVDWYYKFHEHYTKVKKRTEFHGKNYGWSRLERHQLPPVASMRFEEDLGVRK